MFSQDAVCCCHGCPHVPVYSRGTLVPWVSFPYLWSSDTGDFGLSSRVGLPFVYGDAGSDVDARAGASEGLPHGGGAAVMEAGGRLWLRWECCSFRELGEL